MDLSPQDQYVQVVRLLPLDLEIIEILIKGAGNISDLEARTNTLELMKALKEVPEALSKLK